MSDHRSLSPSRRRVGVAAVGAALVLGGCSSSGSGHASGSTPPSTASTTVTQTETPTTTTPTSTAPTSSSAPTAAPTAAPPSSKPGVAADHCTNSQLAISAGQPDGATGHDGYTLLFRNVSSNACTLHGYPGLDAIRPGHPPTHAHRTPYGFLGGSKHGLPTVRLKSGQVASAKMEYTFNDAHHPTGNCPVAQQIAVTAANTTRTVTLGTKAAVCNLQIHPTVPGTSGQDT